MSRRVVLYELLSLDGVAEEPGDWLFEDGPEIFEHLAEVIAAQDDVLLGRATYDYWVHYWPTSNVEPFASFINNTPKHVFSSRPLEGDWPNSTRVSDPATSYVTDLKRGEGGDIGVHGSISLARSLLSAGLVDELRLVIAPAIAGSGARLLDGLDLETTTLQLVADRRTARGSLLLRYHVGQPSD